MPLVCALDRAHVGRRTAKDAPPAVDPANVAIERRQRTHHRRADVPGAEHGNVQIGAYHVLEKPVVDAVCRAPRLETLAGPCHDVGHRGLRRTVNVGSRNYALARLATQVRSDDRCLALPVQRAQVAQPQRQLAGNGFEQYVDHAAATLSHRGSQRKLAQRRRLVVAQHIARDARALVLELAATDRAERLGRGHDHLGADLSRRRAADARNRHQHDTLARSRKVAQFVNPLVHCPPSIALSTASGVAGACSSGSGCSSVAMASRNARNAEMPSISGGSPTAFDR